MAKSCLCHFLESDGFSSSFDVLLFINCLSSSGTQLSRNLLLPASRAESFLRPSSNNTTAASYRTISHSTNRTACLNQAHELRSFLFPSTDDAAAARASAAALLLAFEVSSSCFSPMARMVMTKRSRPVISAEC